MTSFEISLTIPAKSEMAKASMVIEPSYVAIRRRIFVMFTARDGIPNDLAHQEFDRLQSVGGDMSQYLRLQRTGSKYALHRNEKINLALTFDNAGNHASFEFLRD
ncbi:MAG: hypothetical protein EOP83_22165 [Verrucomicrobiaceae bacterium]|nr:MAG: hypothetical protein EOP83_22165 [Verrucomicrobiaceae bacterium]